MKAIKKNTLSFFAVALLILTTTGCMYSPQNMDLMQSIEEPLIFSGAVLSADHNIDLQYWNWYLNQWMNLAEDIQPSTDPVLAHGFTWYIWNYERPHMLVFGMWQVEDESWQIARLRAVMHDAGGPLYTFNSWEFAPDIPLAEFWSTHGNDKREVTIAALY